MNEKEEKELTISEIPYHHITVDRLKILKPHIGDMYTHIEHMEDLEYDEVEQYLLTLPLRTLRMIRRIYYLACTDEWDKMEYVFENSIETGERLVLSDENCAVGNIETNFEYWGKEDEEKERENSTYDFAYVLPQKFIEKKPWESIWELYMNPGGKVLSDKTHFLKHFWRENNPYKFEYRMKLNGFEID